MQQGDKVRIIETDDCNKTVQDTAGYCGVIDIIYQPNNDNANIAVIVDGIKTGNKNGCVYYKMRNLELVKSKEDRGEQYMKTESIINLFENNRMKELKQESENRINELYKLDTFYLSVAEKISDINELLKGRGCNTLNIDASRYTSDITDINILCVKHDYTDDSMRLKEYCSEVKTMCSACDTYEQEVKVLKSYSIIDESGILVKSSFRESKC